METTTSGKTLDYNVKQTTISGNNTITATTDTSSNQTLKKPSNNNLNIETLDLSNEIEPQESKGFFETIGDGIKAAGSAVADGASWAINGLKSVGKDIAETAANVAENIESITAKAWDAVESNQVSNKIADIFSTGAVVANSVKSGIDKIGEWVGDAGTWVGGKVVEGGTWVAGQVAGAFSDEAKENIDKWRKEYSKSIKEEIARDKVGERNQWFFEETELGRRINAHSAIKYDSEVAKKIQGATTVVAEIAAATAVTIATGGTAAAFIAPFLAGAAVGTGKAAESTYQNKGTDTTLLQELGIAGSGALTGLTWVANGKLGQGALEIGKDVIAKGGAAVLKDMGAQMLNKEFLLSRLKDGLSFKNAAGKLNINALMNYGQAAMGTAGSLTPYITGEKEFTATSALELGGTYLKYLGLNILEDTARDYVSGYKATGAVTKILTDAEKAELAAIPDPVSASTSGQGIDADVSTKANELSTTTTLPIIEGDKDIISRPAHIDDVYSKVKTEKIEEQVKKISERLDIPEEEVRKLLDEKIVEILDDSEYGVRVGESTLTKIFEEDGMFKSQFETGYSEGEFDPAFRSAVESRLFGIPKDIDVEDRPVYGMAFPKLEDPNLAEYVSDGPGSQYGLEDGIVAIFDKDKVKQSLTYTLGDSLDHESHISAGLVTDPKFVAGATNGYYRSDFASGIYDVEDLRRAKLTDLFTGDWESYLEIQFHGRESHSIKNLSHILFTNPPSESLLKKIIEKGIPYTILGE